MREVNWDFMFDPPPVFELDVMRVPDFGRKCEFCETGHIIVKVSEETKYGFTAYQEMCATCLLMKYDTDTEPSKFDKKEE